LTEYDTEFSSSGESPEPKPKSERCRQKGGFCAIVRDTQWFGIPDDEIDAGSAVDPTSFDLSDWFAVNPQPTLEQGNYPKWLAWSPRPVTDLITIQ